MAKIGSAAASEAAVRAWLRDVVGVGNTFTLQDLRKVVTDTQADRRMRALRQAIPTPWIIHSSQSDRTLPVDTYRLDQIGGDKLPPRPSARVRREVFEDADRRCQICGVGSGEEYGDYPGELARLQLGHWVPPAQGGSWTARGNLRSECHRCNGGVRNRQGAITTTASVITRLQPMPRAKRSELLRWLEQNQRDVSDGEKLFYETRQLPPVGQKQVTDELRRLVQGGRKP